MEGCAIFGSCVTKDIFNFVSDESLMVSSYVARQSIVSAISNPLKVNKEKIKLESDFQKRCVFNDIAKINTWEYLRHGEANIKNKYLLIDLIDERFDLLKINDSLITCSPELLDSGCFKNKKFKRFKKIKSLNGEWFIGDIYFVGCIEQFVMKIKDIFDEENIIIHKVRMTDYYRDLSGNLVVFQEDVLKENHIVNEMLDFMYACLIEYLPNAVVIDRSGSYFADSSHQWGLAPMHFEAEYYIDVLKEIKVVLQDITNLKKRK